MGMIHISPHTIAFLLQEGIDTVFLSIKGKYRGRLISQFGKNIVLRQMQFRKFDSEEFNLKLARKYVEGKLKNYRTILRRHNRDLNNSEIEKSIHQIRYLADNLEKGENLDSVRGYEGKGSEGYFRSFKYLIKSGEFTFDTRNRRPPKDPVNALLSFGYTLLVNTVQTQVNITGLDPYLGSLHAVDYGRPSLVLDLMEEFRPLIVDAMILRLLNKGIIKLRDFHFADEEELLDEGTYPVTLNHDGMKTFILHYEKQLDTQIIYPFTGNRLTFRQIILEQARKLVRHIKDEELYSSFLIR
jgi:CRISPR-associated protein Cas1